VTDGKKVGEFHPQFGWICKEDKVYLSIPGIWCSEIQSATSRKSHANFMGIKRYQMALRKCRASSSQTHGLTSPRYFKQSTFYPHNSNWYQLKRTRQNWQPCLRKVSPPTMEHKLKPLRQIPEQHFPQVKAMKRLSELNFQTTKQKEVSLQFIKWPT